MMFEERRPYGTGTINQLCSGHYRARILVHGERLSHTTNTEQDAEAWLRDVALERVQETFTNGFQFRQTPRYPSPSTRKKPKHHNGHAR